MGVGLRTNLGNIGGDPLTQLIYYYFFFNIKYIFFFNVWVSRHSQKMNGKHLVVTTDPIIKINQIILKCLGMPKVVNGFS